MTSLEIHPAGTADAAALAGLQSASFTETWTAATFAQLLVAPGGFGLVARADASAPPEGGIVCQVVTDQAEIYFVAVTARRRRQGLGRRLLEAALAGAAARGATHMLLEVAVDNAAALALYRRAGFAEVGRRPGYYLDRAGRPLAALIMRRDLDP